MMCHLIIVISIINSVVLPLSEGSRASSCPPTLSVSQCGAGCHDDASCGPPEICCPTACGGSMCVPPMTLRNFVNLVKEGRCPEYPRGPWICSNTCTGDSDCPRTLKCCSNRCGAKVCLRPEFETQNSIIS